MNKVVKAEPPKAASPRNEPEWQRQQRETFVKWVQNKLKKHPEGRTISDLTDLTDGVALCQLLEAMFPQTQIPRYNKQPKLAAHKLDNLAIVFKFLENADIKVLTKPQNVAEGNTTMILGLLWTLILEFDINRAMKAAAASAAVEKGKNQFNFVPGKAKDSLLEWVRARVQKYGYSPQNFDKDFCDGNVLLALVHSLRPDLFLWPTMDRSNAERNIRTAEDLAEKHMNIPPLLDPAILLGGEPDEKSVMTYVVNFLMYEQENRALIDQLAQKFGALQAANNAEEERRKQEARLAEQKEALRRQQEAYEAQQRQLAEQQKQMALLQQQQQLQQQQAHLKAQQAALDEQRRRMAELEAQKLALQQAALEEQRRKMAEMEQHRRNIEMQQQQMAAQHAQLQMAAEVAKMQFFQALQQRQQRDYVMFIDKSGSMAGARWQEARKAVETLAPQVTRACPQGVSLYFFNDTCVRIDGVTTAEQVHGFFGKEKPDRGTNLLLALKHAFDIHFQKQRPETWLIITDGAPDRPTHVYELLRQCHGMFKNQNEVTVSFIQIGASDDATGYLTKLKGALPFVDTLSHQELPQQEFSSLFAKK